MALRSVISSKIPMVIILGATGTGKTKLSLELAQKFGTEIISADSMQIYKGLDVVTAKASSQEQALVPHHLLDILEPHQWFTVVDFRNRALKIIDNLAEQGKISIVVGGTNYYIESIVYKILVEDNDDTESLLWDTSRRKRDLEDDTDETGCIPKRIALEGDTGGASIRTIETDTNETKSNIEKEVKNNKTKADLETKEEETTTAKDLDAAVKVSAAKEITKEALQFDVDNEKKFTNAEIHDKLKSIDPVMAARLHPNNRRKILRSIEVWLKSGRRHSDVLAEQKLSEGRLRRPGRTIILWLKCDQKVHDDRLNARVDSMIENGLIQELIDFHIKHNKQRIKDGQPPDYTKGIFQTLGFKEFHDYLTLSPEERSSDRGKKLLAESIDNMKMATRRYARRQNKMVKGRFLSHPNRDMPLIYELDTTDVSKWADEVENKAIHIIQCYMDGLKSKYEPLSYEIDVKQKSIDGNSRNFCDICQRIIIGDKTYQIHLVSNRHMKVLKRKKKIEDASKNNEEKLHDNDNPNS